MRGSGRGALSLGAGMAGAFEIRGASVVKYKRYREGKTQKVQGRESTNKTGKDKCNGCRARQVRGIQGRSSTEGTGRGKYEEDREGIPGGSGVHCLLLCRAREAGDEWPPKWCKVTMEVRRRHTLATPSNRAFSGAPTRPLPGIAWRCLGCQLRSGLPLSWRGCVQFEGGGALAFVDSRRFGRIRVVQQVSLPEGMHYLGKRG